MQTNSTPTSGASGSAINAEDAAMKGSDVLQIPLAEMLACHPTMRIDWDRKTVAFEFDFNDANGKADAVNVNGAAQCIQNLCGVPDGASRQTVLVHANRADAGCGVNNCPQPCPCQIHEAQNARGPAEGSGTGSSTPRCTRPLPRRNQIQNGAGSAGPTTASPTPTPTQAGATYDNTNTPPAATDNEGSGDDDDDDDVPLNVVKEKTVAQRKRKAPAATATFEPVIKTEPTEKEPGKRLHPERRQFKIRNLKEHVRWYYTKSIRPINAVPADLLKPRHESLYVHRYKAPFVGRQIWIYVKHAGASGRVQAGANAEGNDRSRDGNEDGNGGADGGRQDGEWRRVEIGDPHPRLEGLVLHMLDENGPRWVKPKSARYYASGKHKRARWAKSM